MIDKELVKNNFKKNFKSYDDNAFVQKEMAEQLIKLIPDNNFSKVLEIGTGTGIFTRLLAEKISFKDFYANDIVSESVQYLEKVLNGAIFIKGDAELIEFPRNLSLVASNATLQWVCDPCEMFSRISSSLKSKGLFVFSTFGAANFAEFRDITGVGLNYLPVAELKKTLEKDFEIIEIFEEQKTLYFKSFRDILKHIKYTGVNGVSRQRLSISEVKELEKKYSEKYTFDKGFALTYNPVFVCACKK